MPSIQVQEVNGKVLDSGTWTQKIVVYATEEGSETYVLVIDASVPFQITLFNKTYSVPVKVSVAS